MNSSMGSSGMAFETVSCEELERTREDLVEQIKAGFTADDRGTASFDKAGNAKVESPENSRCGKPTRSALEDAEHKATYGAKARRQLLERLTKSLQ